jgi:dienelactone hydrolase
MGTRVNRFLGYKSSRENSMQIKHSAKRGLLALSVILLAVGCGGGASSTTSPPPPPPVTDLSAGQTGVISFKSTTPTGIYDLVNKNLGPEITISGTLTFPSVVSGKMPAMILAHHCGGVTSSVTKLATMLNQLGVATFVPDSFTPRGYSNGVCSGSTLPGTVAITDVLNALKMLATHPNIDPDRIGIIGQSFGGNAVYGTAFEEVRTSVITTPLKFAAHIGLYPTGCNTRNWSPNMTGAPMLILLGGADDWTPPAECNSFVTLLNSYTSATAIEYANAPHAWDSDGAINYDANRTSLGNCRFQFRLDTQVPSRYDTNVTLGGTATTDYINSCKSKGASAGRYDLATAAATSDITAFLTTTFNL